MELTIWLFMCIGGAVCLLSGILVITFLASLVTDYAWGKIKNVHNLREIQRAVRAYKNNEGTKPWPIIN